MKQCVKGYPCGNTCINKNRKCSDDLAPETAEQVTQIAATIKEVRKEDFDTREVDKYILSLSDRNDLEDDKKYQKDWKTVASIGDKFMEGLPPFSSPTDEEMELAEIEEKTPEQTKRFEELYKARESANLYAQRSLFAKLQKSQESRRNVTRKTPYVGDDVENRDEMVQALDLAKKTLGFRTFNTVGDVKKSELGRAYTSKEDSHVFMGEDPWSFELFHEIGHHIEFGNPKLAEAARGFRDSRATDKTPRSLKEISGLDYDEGEEGLAGNYLDEYMGKVYPDGSTEILSMGVEGLVDTDTLSRYANEDPEYLRFVLGAILSNR